MAVKRSLFRPVTVRSSCQLGARSPRRRSTALRTEPLERRLALATFAVLTTDDSGAGSLRQAITDANATPGADEIAFNIPGPGPHVIQPLSDLPLITDPLTIDGYTQAGASPNTLSVGNNAVLKITLNGSLAGPDASGFHVRAHDTTIRGLAIGGFDPASVAGGAAIEVRADRATIEGNFIGLDTSGSLAVPNAHGIHSYGAQMRVGSNGDGNSDAQERNVISGNARFGLLAESGGNHRIAGNYIGTNPAGLGAIPNDVGIRLHDGSNIIGTDGLADAEASRNVISGNTRQGILIAFSSFNRVAGNFIGTDVTGTVALPNFIGIANEYSSPGQNVIGTNGDGNGDAAERNVISGNHDVGVLIQNATANIVAGNYIGMDVTGSMPIRNFTGVFLQYDTANNLIGTNADGVSDDLERNVVAANLSTDIRIDSGQDNRVAGNYIGTDVTGQVAFASQSSLRFEATTGNLVGTNGDGVRDNAERNVVVGTVHITAGANANVLAGNFFGTNASGTAPLDYSGIRIFSDNNRIGTNADGIADGAERNVVNGGVRIFGGNHNVVAGNYLGVDVMGTTSLGSAKGVLISEGGSFNRVGTNGDGINDVAERNVISGVVGDASADDGLTSAVIIRLSAHDNLVAGNFIGTDPTGLTPVANLFGVLVDSSAFHNQIGGDGPLGNIIAHSTMTGIVINYNAGVANAISGNSIHSNGALGIDIVADAPPPNDVDVNDAGDADSGPNLRQNYPVLTAAANTGSTIAVAGELHSSASGTFRLELFANSVLDPSGYGEGSQYLGATTVTTDASGNGAFSVTFPVNVPVGHFITATATDADGNTSEFSLGAAVVAGNSAPTASVIGPTAGVRGQILEFILSAVDSPADQLAGFTYSIHWGDASPVQVIPAAPNNGAGVTVPHVYVASGTYTLSITATDQHGATSVAVTTNITISVAAVQPDPIYPSSTMLVVGGTVNNDDIKVKPNSHPAGFEVEINGQDIGVFSPTGRIVIFGQSGDDEIEVAGGINRAAWIYGDGGDDRLKGGAGHDVLLGGSGEDLLVGGQGRDMLIGGTGADRIVGNADDDILIAGTSDHDAHELALSKILAEWTSAASYAARTAHIGGAPGGLNGSYFLKNEGIDISVHDDNAKDLLTGSAGQDWFFANLFLDNGDDANQKDKITDLSASEFAADLDFILS